MHQSQVEGPVFLLRSGHCKISALADDGSEVLLGFRGEGMLVGELTAIDGRPRSASVIAIQPVEALAVPAADFRAYLEKRPSALRVVLEVQIARLRDADAKRLEFAASDTTARVAARLLELAARLGEAGPSGVTIGLPISQEELAAWSGASREATARALRSLRAAGWIETGRRRLVVRDAVALGRRARS